MIHEFEMICASEMIDVTVLYLKQNYIPCSKFLKIQYEVDPEWHTQKHKAYTRKN